MQIKKFSAPTLKQAAEKMKEQLGGEAIILGTRVIESALGDEGDGKIKKLFEVTAGIEKNEDEFSILSGQKLKDLPEAGGRERMSAGSSSYSDPILNYENEIAQLRKKIFNRQSSSDLHTKKESDLSNSVLPKPSAEKIDELDRDSVTGNPELKKIFTSLRRKDVQKSSLQIISDNLKNCSKLITPESAESYVLSSISSLIPTNKLKLERDKKGKKIALVGPTGVGKTTCIAKLAVISKLIHNLDVGLISIDTYRLGAIDQLKIFSEISNIELKVAYEAGEMAEIMNRFRRKDIIFIDTAGRSQNNIKQLYETKDFLNAGGVDETYLAVSSTSSTKLLLDVLNKFKMFNYSSVIYTKIDEAVTFGNILNIAVKKGVPVSFLSNGQVIPDDIIAADSEFISNMVYTGKITR